MAGKNTVNLMVPGWVASPEKNDAGTIEIEDNSVFVFDIFSRTVHRFEQVAGALPPPDKADGVRCCCLSAHC